jgi:magnesium chelatase family protein
LVGGGTPPRPGEISLAHNGVLFLDEIAEFAPAALQAMRQPIEEGVVTLVRANGAIRYPARITLVAAMNPCPCGYAGDPERVCTCSEGAVSRYLGRIGGPMYDRIDISVRVDRIDPSLLLARRQERSSTDEARERVARARAFASSRPPGDLRRALTHEARAYLASAGRASYLSGRAVTRVLRVARTLADMECNERIGTHHVAEALTYRCWEQS